MKNKRSLILNFIVATFSALMIVFMAFNGVGGESGWDTLQAMVRSMGVGVPIAYLVALDLLVFVVAILAILVDFNVIKNEKFAKVVKAILFMASTLMLFLFVVVATQLMTMEYASEILGWASIVNLVLGFATGILAIVNTTLSRKK